MSASKKIGSSMDHIFGTVVLGGVGRAAFHVGKVPGVRKAGAYIRDNVQEGYESAESADLIRKTARNVAQLSQSTGRNPSLETVASMCRDAGIGEDQLERVRDIALSNQVRAAQGGAVPLPA